MGERFNSINNEELNLYIISDIIIFDEGKKCNGYGKQKI
jgi:hypothetical protein